MGESKNCRVARLVAATTAGLAAAMLLTSCSGVIGGPGAVAPSASAVVDASASASAEPTGSATPEASASASATPSAAASASAPAGKAQVVPFITSAAWDAKAGAIDVGAIVPVVVERAGTCTLTATKDGASFSVSGDAVATASYTGCPQLVLKDAGLVAGAWSVTVSYDSDDSAGTSAARTVTSG